MKRLIATVTSILLLSVSAFAQEPLAFSETVAADSSSKKDLFTKAKMWFAEYYKNSKDVLHLQDAASGELLGKTIFKYTANEYISYTIKILVKDGKYKCEIYDFFHRCNDPSACLAEFCALSTDQEYPRMPATMVKKWFNKEWAGAKAGAEQHSRKIMLSLKDAMTVKSKDW